MVVNHCSDAVTDIVGFTAPVIHLRCNFSVSYFSDETEGSRNGTTIFTFPGVIYRFSSFKFSLSTKMSINLPVIVRQRKFNVQKKNNPISMLIRSIIQKLLKELDPGTVSCLPMNSVLSPLTVDGSTCFLLLNHMKRLPSRSAKATLLSFIMFYFSLSFLTAVVVFPGSQPRN